MYNDYYLQEINSKIGTTNTYLSTIITNQESIILNQQEQKEAIEQAGVIITMVLGLYLIYNFVVRCFK